MNQTFQPSLILSLTSHPPRFPFLLEQLTRLADQTFFPDLLVLNIAIEDFPRIPREVTDLDLPFTFEINLVENLGPGKKLIPTILKYPKAIIITIDDDMNYPDNLVESFWQESKKYPGAIIAARAHQPLFIGEELAPYLSWKFEISETSHVLVFPTGSNGVLYPPRSLDDEALNSEAYKELSWSTDDIWFWIHSLRAGTQIRKSEFSYRAESGGSAQFAALNSNGNSLIFNDLHLSVLWNTYEMNSVLEKYIQSHSLSKTYSNLGEIHLFRSRYFEKILREKSFLEMLHQIPMTSRSVYMLPILKLEQQILRLQFEDSQLRNNFNDLFHNVKRKIISKIR
jgi:hypothetical protein